MNVYFSNSEKISAKKGTNFGLIDKNKIIIYSLKYDVNDEFIYNILLNDKVNYIETIEYPVNVIRDSNPSYEVDGILPYMKWLNWNTGEVFTLQNYKINNSFVWIGDKGTFISDITVNTVDLFNDERCFSLIQLDKNPPIDLGGHSKIQIKGNVKFTKGVFGKAALCNSYGKVNIEFDDLITNLDSITISLWVKWSGRNTTMPFGFKDYDLYCYGNYFGFNSGNSDLYGFPFKQYKNKWVHIVATFINGQYGTIWLNGEKQNLVQRYGRLNKRKAKITKEASIFGWRSNNSYTAFGTIDQVRFIKGSVSDEDVKLLYNEIGDKNAV